MSVARRKGSRFEREVVDYLADHGFPSAERRVMGGTRDRGDVAGVPGWVLEVKATRELDLAGAMNEAKLEARNAGVVDYAAIIKRRSHRTEDAYAVVPLRTLVHLLNHQQRAPSTGAGADGAETVRR